MEVLGIWVAAFFTLCIYSFLYRDNPFYRFAEHLFVGLSVGYGIVFSIHQGLIPLAWEPFAEAINAVWKAGKLSRNVNSWDSSNSFRLPLAFAVLCSCRSEVQLANPVSDRHSYRNRCRFCHPQCHGCENLSSGARHIGAVRGDSCWNSRTF